MIFSAKIAKRFMLGGKGAGPSRLTGWISIVGMTIGCVAMILSVSILNGFELRVINKIVGFESDLRISNVTDWKKVENYILNLDGVENVMTFQQRKGLLIGRNNNQRMVLLKSIDPSLISKFYDLNMEVSEPSDLPKVYLGEMTARRLNLNLGDGIRLMSPIDQGSSWGLPIQTQCVVGGVFSIQVLDLDDKIAFIPKDIGKKLFIRKNGPDGLDVRLIDNVDVELISKTIQREFPLAIVKTWADLHSELFNAMQFERIGALFVLSLIILVACFNLVTTLVLVSAQKIRQIGILQVMGCSKNVIKSIIMNQGMMIGLIGILSGLIIGLFLIWVQNTFGVIRLPQDIYFTPFLPMDIFVLDLIIILSISFGMVILSIYIAANRALMVSPLEAIYTEK